MRDYAVFTMVDREGDTIFVGVERLANLTGEYLLSSRSGYKLEDLDIARVAGLRLVSKNLDFETANTVAKGIRTTLAKGMSENISNKQIAPEFSRSITVSDVSGDSSVEPTVATEEDTEEEKSEEEVLAEYASAGISPEVVALARLEDRTEIMIKQAAAYLKARKYMLEEGAGSPNALWHDYLGELLTGRLEAIGVEKDKIITKESWFSRDISAVGKQLIKLARAAEDNSVSIELPPYSEQNIKDIRELRGESLVVHEEEKEEQATALREEADPKKLPKYMTEPVEDQMRRERERSAKVRVIRPEDLPLAKKGEGLDPEFAKHLELPDHLKVQDFDFGNSVPSTGDPIVDALVKEYSAPASKKTQVFDDEKEQNKFLILSHTLELLKASLAKRREQYDLQEQHLATAVKLERKMRARKIPESDIVTQSDVGRTRTGEVKILIKETELEIQELKQRKFEYETSKPISNEERLELTLRQEEEILKTMKESGLSNVSERNKQRAKIRAIKEKIAAL